MTHTRKIRSFVKREGRLTHSQAHAIHTLLPKYGIEINDTPLNFKAIFGNHNDMTLEIGFGMGQSLAQMAELAPHSNFIGIEVHTPGVGMILNEIHTKSLWNLKIIQADAVEILTHHIPDNSLNRINIFFPDPWHKARHHKRRLIQTTFTSLLAQKLIKGGILHLATDWENYAEQMMKVLTESREFKNTYAQHQFAPHSLDRPETKFERRGLKLGHGVWDLVFENSPSH